MHNIYANAAAARRADTARSWHGLESLVPAGASLETWIAAAGMDYTIVAAPVEFRDPGGRMSSVPGRKVLYRSDTGAPLAVVSDQYKPVQPREILDFFISATADAGLNLNFAGVLGTGAHYWALADFGARDAVIAGDRHKQYVLLTTSCDGSRATTAKMTTVRVVCQNTLAIAMRSRQGEVRTSHRSQFDAAATARALGLADAAQTASETAETVAQTLARMAEVHVTDDAARHLLAELLGAKPRETAAEAQTFAELLARPVNAAPDYQGRPYARAVQSYYRAPGAVPGTLYGVLQGITHYADHAAQTRGGAAGRQQSAMIGGGATLKDRAFVTLSAIADDIAKV